MAQTNKVTFMTPQGIAVYPWLTRPDDKFDTDGVYKTKLRMSQDEGKALAERIKKVANDEFGEKAKIKLPFETDSETGELVFMAKSKYRPQMTDASGQVLPENKTPPIMGGATLKLAGTIFPYDVGSNKGISLQIRAVQIIELAEGTNTGSNPFEAVEGGFIASNDNTPSEGAQSGYDF